MPSLSNKGIVKNLDGRDGFTEMMVRAVELLFEEPKQLPNQTRYGYKVKDYEEKNKEFIRKQLASRINFATREGDHIEAICIAMERNGQDSIKEKIINKQKFYEKKYDL